MPASFPPLRYCPVGLLAAKGDRTIHAGPFTQALYNKLSQSPSFSSSVRSILTTVSTICCHTSNSTLGCTPLSLVTSWRDRARGSGGERRGGGEVPDVYHLYRKYVTCTTTRIHTYTPDVVAAQRTHGLHRPQKAASQSKHTDRQTHKTHTHILHTPNRIHIFTLAYVRTYCSGSIQTDHKCSMLRMHFAPPPHTPLQAGRTTSIMSRTLFCSSFSKSRPLAWGRVNHSDWKTLVTRFCTKKRPAAYNTTSSQFHHQHS